MADETQKPLSVAVAVVINDQDQILLMQRRTGDYVGFWSLPGGKVEQNEHLDQAAVRELKEETNVTAEFDQHLGLVSEHLQLNGQVDKHFLLHICQLRPKESQAIEVKLEEEEGNQLQWWPLSNLPSLEEGINPSDAEIIEQMIKQKKKGYYRCVMDKQETGHQLKDFKLVNSF